MKVLRPLAVAVGGTLAVHWSPAPAAVFPGVAKAFGIPTRIESDGVLLTFDDGPHRDGTPAVLAELDRVGASAVFFVCGEQVERYPELVSEIVAAGHELGLHGYRHWTRLQWSGRLLADDMSRARAAVADAAGIEPRLYRPPFGVFSLAGTEVDPRARARAAALVQMGPRLGALGDTRDDHRPVPPRVSRQATWSCCTTPITTPRAEAGGKLPPRSGRSLDRISAAGLKTASV